MAELLMKVTLGSDTGIPADSVTNSFAVEGFDPSDSADVDSLFAAFEAFYNLVPAGGLVAVKDSLSSVLDNSANGCRMALYNVSGSLGGTPYGSPIADEFWQLNAAAGGAGQPLPSEVAFAVTLEAFNRENQPVEAPDGADPGGLPDRPRQRYTGRVFLGPFRDSVLSIVDGVCRPHSSLTDTAELAVVALQDSIQTIQAAADLAVWSRVDATMRRVDNVSTDNSFDTIRSRGERPTLRSRRDV